MGNLELNKAHDALTLNKYKSIAVTILRRFAPPTLALSAALAFPALANTVSRITPGTVSPELNKPFSLNFTFAENSSSVSCGLTIDWGDGKVDRLRVGEGQQLMPPYTTEHTYAAAGDYRIRISGETIIRGVRSVLPCNVRQELAVKVADPVEVARLAAIKEAQERERQEQERQRREQEEARKAEVAARLAREAAEREAYLKSPQGRKDQEAMQRAVAQLLNKPLAVDCNSSSENVWVFQGDRNGFNKRQDFSEARAMTEQEIVKFEFNTKDTVFLAYRTDPSRNIELKVTANTVQIVNNGDLVKNGLNGRGEPTPTLKLCGGSTAAARTVANELSGAAAKARDQRARNEAIAKERQRKAEFERKNYRILFICSTSPNPSAHAGLAMNVILAAKGGPQMYASVITSYRGDCSSVSGQKPFNNMEMFESGGRIVHRTNGKEYGLVTIDRFSTAGIIGDE